MLSPTRYLGATTFKKIWACLLLALHICIHACTTSFPNLFAFESQIAIAVAKFKGMTPEKIVFVIFALKCSPRNDSTNTQELFECNDVIFKRYSCKATNGNMTLDKRKSLPKKGFEYTVATRFYQNEARTPLSKRIRMNDGTIET